MTAESDLAIQGTERARVRANSSAGLEARARSEMVHAARTGGLVLLEGSDPEAVAAVLQAAALDLAPTARCRVIRASPLAHDEVARVVLDAFAPATGEAPAGAGPFPDGGSPSRGNPQLLLVQDAEALPDQTVRSLAMLANESGGLVRVVLAVADRRIVLASLAGLGICVDLVRLDAEEPLGSDVEARRSKSVDSSDPVPSVPTLAPALPEAAALGAKAVPEDVSSPPAAEARPESDTPAVAPSGAISAERPTAPPPVAASWEDATSLYESLRAAAPPHAARSDTTVDTARGATGGGWPRLYTVEELLGDEAGEPFDPAAPEKQLAVDETDMPSPEQGTGLASATEPDDVPSPSTAPDGDGTNDLDATPREAKAADGDEKSRDGEESLVAPAATPRKPERTPAPPDAEAPRVAASAPARPRRPTPRRHRPRRPVSAPHTPGAISSRIAPSIASLESYANEALRNAERTTDVTSPRRRRSGGWRVPGAVVAGGLLVLLLARVADREVPVAPPGPAVATARARTHAIDVATPHVSSPDRSPAPSSTGLPRAETIPGSPHPVGAKKAEAELPSTPDPAAAREPHVAAEVKRAVDELLAEDVGGRHEDALYRLVELGPGVAGPELVRELNARRRGTRTPAQLRSVWKRARTALCDSALRDPGAGPPPIALACPQPQG
jgi:hypothetical protein